LSLITIAISFTISKTKLMELREFAEFTKFELFNSFHPDDKQSIPDFLNTSGL